MYFLRQGIQLSTHLSAVQLLVGHHGIDLAARVQGHVLHQGVVARLNIDHLGPGLAKACTWERINRNLLLSSTWCKLHQVPLEIVLPFKSHKLGRKVLLVIRSFDIGGEEIVSMTIPLQGFSASIHMHTEPIL